MNGGGWVGDLIAEQKRQTEKDHLEAERELLRFKKFCALAPIIWSDIEGRVRACIDVFNREITISGNRLNIKASGSYSMLIASDARLLQAFMISLEFDSGILRYGYAGSPRTQHALIVTIDHKSHWSLEDAATHANVPTEYVDRVLLSDFLKSMPF